MLCVVAYSMEDRRANTRTNCLFTLAAADRYEAINLCERIRTDSHTQKHARSEGCGVCFNTDRSICTLFMCVYGAHGSIEHECCSPTHKSTRIYILFSTLRRHTYPKMYSTQPIPPHTQGQFRTIYKRDYRELFMYVCCYMC